MKFTGNTVLSAPIERINLEDWIFSLSDSEYQATARGHRAAGTFSDGEHAAPSTWSRWAVT